MTSASHPNHESAVDEQRQQQEPSIVDTNFNKLVSESVDATAKTEEIMSNNSSRDNEDKETDGKENKENVDDSIEVQHPQDFLPTPSAASSKAVVQIGDYAVDYLIERANKKIDKRTADWDVLNHTMDVPQLSIQEIELGRFLGEGGFFKVHEIQKITLMATGGGDDESETESREIEKLQAMRRSRSKSDEVGVVQNRRYLEKHCTRPGKNGHLDCRYAIKTMKKCALSDPGLFVNTLVDMAIEAKFLSSVRHPNIIKMRGISKDFTSAGADSFIILDRLYQTLTDKIVSWKDKKENSFGFLFDFRGKKQKAFLAERLTVGFDIANALEYLHDRKYVTTEMTVFAGTLLMNFLIIPLLFFICVLQHYIQGPQA